MRFIWIATALLLSFAQSAFAVTTEIISYPTSISQDSFKLTVSVASASAGTNYLRVDLYKEGSSHYFGETDNGQNWYGGSDGKQYFPITILSGSPTIATVSGRMGEPSLLEYPGPGLYKLRIRRYTASGNQGSEDILPKDVTLTHAWASPSPSPTPTPTPSPSPSVIPSPTLIPSPPATPKSSPSPLPSPTDDVDLEATVAGVSTDIDLSMYGGSPSSSPTVIESQSPRLNSSRLKRVLMIGGGLILVSVASFFGYRKYLRYNS